MKKLCLCMCVCVCVCMCVSIYTSCQPFKLISLTVEEEETLQLRPKEFAIQVGMRLHRVLVLFDF